MRPHRLDDVGAVIVTHSRFDLAAAGAAAMVAAVGGADRVVVVVNVDDPTGVAALVPTGARLVVNDVPLGYGANLNRGVAALPAGVRAALLLNDDVGIDADSIGLLVAALDADDRVAVSGPSMRAPDGSRQATAFRFPTVRTEVIDDLLGPRRLVHAMRVRWGRAGGPVEWLQGAALLVRRSAFDAVGGFDDGYHLYFEELDLARRLAEAGWRVAHVEDAVAVHDAHSTLGRSHLDSYRRSRARYFEQHWPAGRRRRLRVALAIVHGWDALVAGVAAAVGLDRRGTRRGALRLVRDRRPDWEIRREVGTASPRP